MISHVHACIYYVSTCNNVVYVRISIRVLCPTHDNQFFMLLKAHFSKWLDYSVLFHATAIHCHLRIKRLNVTNLPQIQRSHQLYAAENWIIHVSVIPAPLVAF